MQTHTADEISQNIILKAISTGDTEIVKRTYYLHNIDIHFDQDEMFRYACAVSTLDVVKWIASLDDNFTKSQGLNDVFTIVCATGKLDILEWLYSLGTIDVHYDNEIAFIAACENGQLETAKWLIDLGNINYLIKNNAPFRNTCRYGYVDIATWLYNIGASKNVDMEALLVDIFFDTTDQVIEWIMRTFEINHGTVSHQLSLIDISYYKYFGKSIVDMQIKLLKWVLLDPKKN